METRRRRAREISILNPILIVTWESWRDEKIPWEKERQRVNLASPIIRFVPIIGRNFFMETIN